MERHKLNVPFWQKDFKMRRNLNFDEKQIERIFTNILMLETSVSQRISIQFRKTMIHNDMAGMVITLKATKF